MQAAKRIGLTLAKLAVVVAIVLFVGSRLSLEDRWVGSGAAARLEPGLRSTWQSLDAAGLGLAVLLAAPAFLMLAWRWRVLLRAVGVTAPAAEIVRLTFLGNFFGNFGPGGLGGDVVRGLGIARLTERKAEAVATLLVDRVTGLLGLLLMAVAAVALRYEQLGGLARTLGWLLAAALAGGALYFAPWLRRLLRLEALLSRLPPSLRRLEQALYGLRERLPAVAAATGITMLLQLCMIGAIRIAGEALGIREATLWHYLAIVPIAYLFNALPVSPGGFGLLEAAFQQLLLEAGLASASQGFMLGLTVRLLLLFWSLPGLVFWLTGPALTSAPRPVTE